MNAGGLEPRPVSETSNGAVSSKQANGARIESFVIADLIERMVQYMQ